MVHFQLHDMDVFDAAGLTRALGLKPSAVRTAVRRRTLTGSRRAGRTWFTGAAVRAWLFGESPTPEPSANGHAKRRVRQ
jgi:hypothetical protein